MSGKHGGFSPSTNRKFDGSHQRSFLRVHQKFDTQVFFRYEFIGLKTGNFFQLVMLAETIY